MFIYLGIDLETYEKTKGFDLSDLAQREKAQNTVRLAMIEKHMKNGVIFREFDNIYIDDNVKIGSGTLIRADQHLRGNTVIGQNCKLEAGNILDNATIGNEVTITKSVLTDCRIGAKTTVGPFAHVHTGSKIERECRIGNFVEIKNATAGVNTKMAHLAYVGDVDIGNQCNVGCGSIFVNYDGKNKHRSTVGDSVFIGSNSNVVAPVRIEDNAYIAAGTTVTVDLPRNCMCIGRSRETVKENRSKYHKNIFNKRYFGTDGIRGVYGEGLTDEIAYMVGNFLGYSSIGGKIVIGRDTRVSGGAISAELIRGATDAGATVVDLAITSTPSVAYVTSHIGANYGIVVSASHNPAKYNGIKIFNYDGRKLTDIEEVEIETHIDGKTPVYAETKGAVSDGKKYLELYQNEIKTLIGSLAGLKVVLDCSNGAVSDYAPRLFRELGAEVFSYNDAGDGAHINENCGAVYPSFAAQKVLEDKADVGFSFDGDADRVIAVNKKGQVVDGDSIIYVVAKCLKAENRLTGDRVVGTVMSNLGVEECLKKMGVSMVRTDVGDHYVMEEMLRDGALVGGENSGHIILREFSNTGDGVLAGLYLCKLMCSTGKDLSKLDDSLHFPQVLLNIVTEKKKEIMTDADLKKFIEAKEQELAMQGRILLRASGTEPKIRIMAECFDRDLAEQTANEIKSYIEEHFSL